MSDSRLDVLVLYRMPAPGQGFELVQAPNARVLDEP